MLDSLLAFIDFQKKHKGFILFRQLLNVLFTIGITSFIFQTFYFDYKIIDLTDYNALIIFFTQGAFFIPFFIFCIVWSSTHFLSKVFFSLFDTLLITKAKRYIDFIYANLDEEAAASMQLVNKLYVAVKKGLGKHRTEKVKAGLINFKNIMVDNFILFIRGFIAASIYFNLQHHFGKFLYCILILIMVIGVSLFLLGYFIAEILPYIANKISDNIESNKSQQEKTN